MVIVTADKLVKKGFEPVKYIVEGLIPEQSLVYCFGESGSFKTNFLIYTSLCCVKGIDVLGNFETKQCKVMYIDEENRELGMIEKINLLSTGLSVNEEELKDFQLVISEDFTFSPEGMTKLEPWIKDFKPELIIIDSVAKVFAGDENSVMHVRRIFRLLKPLIEKYYCTFVLIHHKRKNNGREWWDNTISKNDVPGSREFVAQADSVFALDKRSCNSFMLKQVKNRYAGEEDTINFNVFYEGTCLKLLYDGKVRDKFIKKSEQIQEEIMKWVKSRGSTNFRRQDCVNAMKPAGFKESNIDSALKSLVSKGRLEKDEKDYGCYKISGGTTF